MNSERDSLAGMRRDYRTAALTEEAAGADPMILFGQWFEQARQTLSPDEPWYEVNAVTLATADSQGRPSARVVLLKDFDGAGFVFFTNYRSRKGREIAARPAVALCVHWPWLERQVRVEGLAEPIDRAESLRYFQSRPRGSQLGAWVSDQSQPMTREEMAERLAELETRFAGREVPCPSHWGGYRVKPHSIEFWQGRPNRLHDRIVFTQPGGGEAGGWRRERIGP